MKPEFSFVIAVAPYRNAEVIKSLNQLDYPKNKFEVIIERGLNPSDNRNRGAKKARGKFLAFIDDDAIVDKKLLKEAKKFFDEHGCVDIVGGPQMTPLDERGFAKISGYALASKFGGWETANRYSGKKVILNAEETMLTSANLFCKREVMKRLQFNPKLWPGEDSKFIEDAKKIGMSVAYYPGIIVYHRRRDSLGKLIKQIYSYGKTRPEKESIKETLKMPFFIVPSLFLIYLIALFLLSVPLTITGVSIGVQNTIYSKTFVFFSIPLVFYFILDFLFSGVNAFKSKDLKALLVLPAVYPVIHLSYGLGFFISSIKRLLKR
ncbi:MAG: glycosyltransferase [Nanoarchaeota archaeon]|nr:glycosyltransferase [Nanoarchaeota archaeon]MBU4086033.1 glycosyltransferase [Nanoarchaeota archaeon]